MIRWLIIFGLLWLCLACAPRAHQQGCMQLRPVPDYVGMRIVGWTVKSFYVC